MADIFGCKISTFPIKYLGVPLSNKRLSLADWNTVVDIVTKKSQNWKGTGGRSTLLNSVMSAVPLYMLSLYKLPIGIQKRMDRVRAQFMWQGTCNHRKKYTLVS